MRAKIFYVDNDKDHLLLVVNGRDVVNGAYRLIKKNNCYYTPYTHFPVHYLDNIEYSGEGYEYQLLKYRQERDKKKGK